MAAKNIPETGEVFKGYIPANRQLHRVKFGAGDTTADVVVGDTGEYALITVTEPIVVFGLWTQVETAFTASVTCTIGDSTTADRFIADTTMNPAGTGAVLVAATGLTVPYVYASAADLIVSVAGATAAAGLASVYVDYAVLAD